MDIAKCPMSVFPKATQIIKRYEGFKAEAVKDFSAGEGVYVIGHGLNFYPDGSRVMAGQKITKAKAAEYLEDQIQSISKWLNFLQLDIDENQEESLVSFIHSIGIEAFEESEMLAYLSDGKTVHASEEFAKWIFNDNYLVIPNMLSRRKEERALFLSHYHEWDDFSTQLLVECFQNYSGTEAQDLAIHDLEGQLDPYVLAHFLNVFLSERKPLQTPMQMA